MAKSILGVHHVTAIAGDPDPNLDFDTRLLGLRLVKITVNFDDPASYHLYYEDSSGHLGTILTFFLWPGMRRGGVGSSQVTATSFAIPSGAGQYWRERLRAHSTEFEIQQERLGESFIAFRDRCEASDIALVNCDPYVRDWITRQHSGK
jgi:glyoxalase family protein